MRAHLADAYTDTGRPKQLQTKSYTYAAGAKVSEDDYTRELIGEPKGMKYLLMEQGRWPADGLPGNCKRRLKDHTDSCCAVGCMLATPAFDTHVPKLEELIKERGHLCIFLPKVRACPAADRWAPVRALSSLCRWPSVARPGSVLSVLHELILVLVARSSTVSWRPLSGAGPS